MSLRTWDGVRAFFGGVGFIVTRPSMWGYALVPTLVVVVLGSGLSALGIWGAARGMDALIGDGSTVATAGKWFLTVLLSIVALLVALLVAFSLAQPLSGFALDAIARKQETELGGRTWPDQPLGESLVRSMKVNLTGLAFSLPAFAGLTIVELFAPPAAVVTIPLKFLVSSLMLSWDFLDYPLGLRHAGVRDRFRFITNNFGAVLAFGLLGTFVLLIPGLGIVLLPYGVAGAARLVTWADAK